MVDKTTLIEAEILPQCEQILAMIEDWRSRGVLKYAKNSPADNLIERFRRNVEELKK